MIKVNWEQDDWYNWQGDSEECREFFGEIEQAHYFYKDGDMISGDLEEPASFTWEVHFIEIMYRGHLEPPEHVWTSVASGTTTTFEEAKWKAERAFDRWAIAQFIYEEAQAEEMEAFATLLANNPDLLQ